MKQCRSLENDGYRGLTIDPAYVKLARDSGRAPAMCIYVIFLATVNGYVLLACKESDSREDMLSKNTTFASRARRVSAEKEIRSDEFLLERDFTFATRVSISSVN